MGGISCNSFFLGPTLQLCSWINSFFCACLALTLPQLTRSADLDWLTSVCTWIESAKEIHVYFKINSSIRCSLLWHTAKICCLNQHSALGSFCLLVDQGNPEYTQVYKNEPHRLWLDTNGYIYQNTDSLTISPGDYNIFSWLNRCELLQFTWKQCKIK